MQQFEEAGQGHIFDAWGTLNKTEKQILIDQCSDFDPIDVNNLF